MFANTSDWRFDTLSSHHYVRFIDLATQGKMEEALALYAKIRPIKAVSRKWWGRLVGRTGGALPVQMAKYWGELMGLAHGPVRPPLLPLTPDERDEMRRDLVQLGLVQP
jgi:dihydrodipicolinate synthase/N-acetylneuraminate lyase